MRCSLARDMIQGLYNSAAAANGLQTWNDVLARNIAAGGSPGFKKDSVGFEGIFAGTMEFGANASRPIEQMAMAPVTRAEVSFVPGEMRRSDNPLEFAIEGDGFFRLQRPDGAFVYTRDGEFRLSADGQLQSKQGFPVVGDSGPIRLLSDGGPVSVDAEGRIRQGDNEVGVLSVFTFANPAALRRTPGGFVVDADSGVGAQPAPDAIVRQGFLEQSNVSAVQEMVDMISVSNALQANQRVVQNLDSLMERAVQVLGAT